MGSYYNLNLYKAAHTNFNELAELLEKEELPQSAQQARNMLEILRFKMQAEFQSKTQPVRVMPQSSQRTAE